MATDAEIGRALAAVAATLNDSKLERFDASRVQAMVDTALDGKPQLRVDAGGGLHDESERRVGAIRRTPSGEWITDRQNLDAMRSDPPIPVEPRKDR
jgi:hypothetical protein